MLAWLYENANVISTVANVAMFMVWVIYLQLMYSDYRRRRRPRMIIHQAQGFSARSHCLLINMSQETIHVQCVQAAALGPEGERTCQLIDYQAAIGKDTGRIEMENVIRQGPLSQGEFLYLGTFEEILELVLGEEAAAPPTEEVEAVEIRVAAVYGDSDHAVGARRRFDLSAEGDPYTVRAATLHTEQLHSRRQRRQAREWLKQCMEG